MRKEDLWTICFAAIVCIVCSLVVSTAADLLRDKQEHNAKIDRQINVLRAFGVDTHDPDGKRALPTTK